MEIDVTAGGSGGFKMKKGMFGCGMLLTFLIPLVSTPIFFFTDEIEKVLSIPSSYSGAVFTGGIILIVGGTLLGALMLFSAILIPLFSMMGSKNNALKNGTSAEAKILAVTDTGTRINHNPLVNFSLEVHPSAQQAFIVNVSQTVSVIHLPSYQPGKMLNVKYIPGTNEVAITGLKLPA